MKELETFNKDSDGVTTVRKWTLGEVQERAIILEKPFDVNDGIKDRLESDLSDGALVLFTREDVEKTFELGLYEPSRKQALTDLVVEKNDIAIIPKDALENWQIVKQVSTRRPSPPVRFSRPEGDR